MDFDQVFYDLVDLDLGEILENEPMYKTYNFLKWGGPARFFVHIKDIDALGRGDSLLSSTSSKTYGDW